MGNIVLKEDGFTPVVDVDKSVKEIPLPYVQLAQSYVDKIAKHPHVRKSEWKNVWVLSAKDEGTFALQCGFTTLMPYHPTAHSGRLPIFGGPQIDFSSQITEMRSWLPIKSNAKIRMIIGPGDEYLVWIDLILPTYEDQRDEEIRVKDAEIARLQEMLYWSPQGEGFQQTHVHFQETVKNMH
jgi:hypothetical protein